MRNAFSKFSTWIYFYWPKSWRRRFFNTQSNADSNIRVCIGLSIKKATAPGFRFGEGHLRGVDIVGGPGAEPSGLQKNFENLSNISKENWKRHYFRRFLKKFKKPRVKFPRVWTKNTIAWGFLRNFWKLLMKMQ